MKHILIVSLFLGLFANAYADTNPNVSCNDKVKQAARAIWSVNSGVDMKFLVGKIRGSGFHGPPEVSRAREKCISL